MTVCEGINVEGVDTMQETAAASEAESSGGSGGGGTVIIIVLVIVGIMVAIGVTLFAQKKKILCFKKSSSDTDEATGESPLLKSGTPSASKLTSPSRATSTATGATSKSAN